MTLAPKEDHWKAKFAAISRRAFECHVLELIRGNGPIQDALYREDHGHSPGVIFRNAELVGEYPKVRVRIYMYDRARDLEMAKEYPVWDKDFAAGEVVDVENMRSPEYIVGEIMVWARGG
ncbi:MAG TPA: hypothetical protein VNO20_10895 [Solirubrobacterales bacterium]|nr:hypothetical protein [Solirubrobacterales bacterium]